MSEENSTSSGFLTKSEAATTLRVSEITVSRLISAGKLAAFRVGRRVLITQQAVSDFLQNNERGTKAA